VDLPELSQQQASLAAKNSEAGAGENPYELKYHHYSVIMNGKRRLAFVSAVNIDGSTSKDFDRSTGVITDPMQNSEEDNSEASELWFPERRIEPYEQTPRDFYEGQTTFDAQGNPILDKRSGGHRNRMFQKGHLTRRQDPLWGNDDQLIRYANADTFHVTNCSPQVGFFNMGIRKRLNSEARPAVHPGGDLYWRALEEYVLTNARADRQRVSVFTGPVFDDENDIPWDRGRQDMSGFKAPRMFWKLILRVDDGALQATALVVDQSPLIDVAPEALLRGEALPKPLPYEKVAKYHYSVPELERLTVLDFGEVVRAADTFSARGRGAGRGRREVRKIDDVTLSRVSRRPARAASSRTAARKKRKR
jgi:endonuclease G